MSFCYWKQLLEKHEPLDTLLQRRFTLKAKHEEVGSSLQAVETKQRAHFLELENTKSRWKKLLGIDASDSLLETLCGEVRRLREEFKDISKQLKILERNIEAVRNIRKQFNRASKMRAMKAKFRRREQELAKQFQSNSLALASQTEFDRSIFNIRKKDYKRGNPLDNYFRDVMASRVILAFENKCVRCGGSFDLTLDHFAIPKNEGGNFVLMVKQNGSIKLNIVVLCRSCNSIKGELSYLDFFTPAELARANEYQENLLLFVLHEENILRIIKKWYRGG